MHYYLTGWQGAGTHEDPYVPQVTSGQWSVIDLRPDSTVTTGVCLVATDVPPASLPAGSVGLGTDPLAVIPKATRTKIEGALGVTLAYDTLQKIALELLTDHAGVAGRWKKLLPTGTGPRQWEIWLGGLLYSVPRVAGGATFSESFNTANGTTLGPDLTWTEVVGDWVIDANRAKLTTTGTRSSARAEHDVGSADMYSEAVVAELPDLHYVDATALVRFSATADTSYMAMVQRGNADEVEIRKIVAGTATALTAVANTTAAPFTLRCEVNGSTVKAFVGGVEISSTTDTEITGHTRGGIGGYGSQTTRLPFFDSFTTGSLGADDTPVAGGAATETSTANAGTSTVAVTVAGGSVTETQTASAGSSAATVPVAGASVTETDTAAAGGATVASTVAGAAATETQTASAGSLTVVLTIAGSAVTETHTATAGSATTAATIPGGSASETSAGSAGTTTVDAVITGSTVTETQTASAGTSSGAGAVAGSTVAETQTALTGVASAAVTVAGGSTTETSTASAGAVSTASGTAGSAVTEAQTAFVGTVHVAVLVAGTSVVDTQTAAAGTGSITLAGATASELNTAATGQATLALLVAGSSATEVNRAYGATSGLRETPTPPERVLRVPVMVRTATAPAAGRVTQVPSDTRRTVR